MKNLPSLRPTAGWAAAALFCLLGASALADAGDPAGRVARLSYIQGSVSLQPSGEDDWSRASVNYTVTTGDRIYTDSNSRSEMEIGPFAVRIDQTTDLTITRLDDRLLQLTITRGTMRVTLFDLPSDGSVEIDTPNGALALLRAGTYRVDCDAGGGTTSVSVDSGSLEVSGGSVARAVQGGEAVQLTGTDPIEVNFVAIPDQDAFDQWCADRDKRIRSSAARRYVQQDVPGIEDLDTYGGWETVASYGPVWYPSNVEPGWAPYRVGHWAWVEPWGWTWVGHEPWGFSPYHYGRWAMFGSRWGWVPGQMTSSPVYAPALVAFVGGGGIGVQAWFPLGPREPYFPPYHHGDRYLRDVNTSNVRDIRQLGDLTNPTAPERMRYANRGSGTTAVPADVFRGGQAISKKTVPAGPFQSGSTSVGYSPEIAPSETAAFRGTPPLRPAKFTGPVPGPRGSPVRTQLRAPDRATPPTTVRNAAPPVTVRNPPAPSVPRSAPPTTGPRVFTRNPPPQREVPFAVRAPVLATQPGRPLEPQQRQNLRDGRPAGPTRDKTVPVHGSRGSTSTPRPAQPLRRSSPPAAPADASGPGAK